MSECVQTTPTPPNSAPCIVITGAGRGIGKAAAFAFAARGCHIALLSRNPAEVALVAQELGERGAHVVGLVCDVSDAGAVEAAKSRVLAELGTPHAIINNAGVIRRGRVHELSESDWDLNLNVNLKGTFLVTRAFLPRMLEARRGRIVNVASISATLGTAGASAYCAAKWGVVGFTKSLCEELRGTGLQTMAVLPGSVDTEMLKGSGFPAQMRPETVAESLLYAALDAPDAMNGACIDIFGP
jgi:NAD(P)-dependent dehydrogenase (short-subunit alcohol dehydrogenase family)